MPVQDRAGRQDPGLGPSCSNLAWACRQKLNLHLTGVAWTPGCCNAKLGMECAGLGPPCSNQHGLAVQSWGQNVPSSDPPVSSSAQACRQHQTPSPDEWYPLSTPAPHDPRGVFHLYHLYPTNQNKKPTPTHTQSKAGNNTACRQKLGDRIQEELGVTRVGELRSITLYAAAKPFGPAVASFLTSLPHGGPDEPVK